MAAQVPAEERIWKVKTKKALEDIADRHRQEVAQQLKSVGREKLMAAYGPTRGSAHSESMMDRTQER
jgi:hypothetical protein